VRIEVNGARTAAHAAYHVAGRIDVSLVETELLHFMEYQLRKIALLVGIAARLYALAVKFYKFVFVCSGHFDLTVHLKSLPAVICLAS
jgi:hypothetical protein